MREKTGKLALAIGDGANDVGMILNADVGVGISGKEGRQAVLSSDYSIAQFRFLGRLLLVHGRLNFYRNVDLINYSFYKNMVMTFNQIIFGFFSHFGGNTVYDSILFMIFNVFFTSVPPVIFAGLERDVSLASLQSFPILYQLDGRREYYQSYLRYWLSLLLGIVHAITAFFVCYISLAGFVFQDGTAIGLADFGTTLYICVVTITNLRIACMCHNWTWLHHLFIWASIAIVPGASIFIEVTKLSLNLVGTTAAILRAPVFYLTLLTAIIAAMIPVIAIEALDASRDSVRNRILGSENPKVSNDLMVSARSSMRVPLVPADGEI
jgi:magnesium-transporting ATPase (P-type)